MEEVCVCERERRQGLKGGRMDFKGPEQADPSGRSGGRGREANASTLRQAPRGAIAGAKPLVTFQGRI